MRMIWWWILFTSMLLSRALGADTLPETAPTNWKLTFADEFDTFDSSVWSTKYLRGNRFLGGQGEKEIYVDPTYRGDAPMPLGLNPFSVADGILSITADRPSPQVRAHLGGQLYTSGLLTTANYFSQLYGYFELRARLPFGKGLWPAFWLLPIDQSWPPEIDVVEMLGDKPTTMNATVHFVGSNPPHAKKGFALKVADMTAGFHTYGVLWSPNMIGWYFDGKKVASMPTPSSVHRPMYLLINLAVGGDWPGQPDASTKFPAVMQLDWVHVYDLASNLWVGQ